MMKIKRSAIKDIMVHSESLEDACAKKLGISTLYYPPPYAHFLKGEIERYFKVVSQKLIERREDHEKYKETPH